jgi:hypothetical protein
MSEDVSYTTAKAQNLANNHSAGTPPYPPTLATRSFFIIPKTKTSNIHTELTLQLFCVTIVTTEKQH